jgi:hypothetical protein
MDDYKLIFEKYKQMNEAGFSYAGNYSDSTEQPKRQLAKFKIPRPDYRNSTGINTASLPGGVRQVNIGAMGTGGGIGENEETINVKGYGNMSIKDINGIYNTVMKEVHALKANGDIEQLKPKLELLKTLANLM